MGHFSLPRFIPIYTILLLVAPLRDIIVPVDAKKSTTKTSTINLNTLDYRVFPRRTPEEAAVIEWGHSAIISALDVSVAHFGPQTNQAAIFEVETQPVLATPIDGLWNGADGEPIIQKLDNADKVKGNVVLMTNTAKKLSGVQLAQIAQLSGAAALVVVNVDELHPDDIYRLPAEPDVQIDIPTVMISYNSASVLTTATVTPEMQPDEIQNDGMPERIRLYAGGDRPFFEDVTSSEPPIYLIHHLLTPEECSSFIRQAEPKLTPIQTIDRLQLQQVPGNYINTKYVMLWQGIWQSAARKAIEERIEQATGFPGDHLTDFVVYRLDKGATWKPHYDQLDSLPGGLPIASITIFLSDVPSEQIAMSASSIVYPSAKGGPVQVRPQKGLAIIHHNWNERQEFESNSVHALLEHTDDQPIYIARKYVVASPLPHSRRILLPFVSWMMGGGQLPLIISMLYEKFLDQFGQEAGDFYFEKLCVLIPLLLVAGLVKFLVTLLSHRRIVISTATPTNNKDQQSKKNR